MKRALVLRYLRLTATLGGNYVINISILYIKGTVTGRG